MPDPNNLTFVDDKLTFMLIPKAANTSFKLAVARAWGLPAEYPGLNHYMNLLVAEHGVVRTWSKQVIAQQPDHLVVALVRHPQARLASWLRDKAAKHHVSAQRLGLKRNADLDEVVSRVCATEDEDCDQHYRSMTHELVLDGQLLPQVVLRVESLARGWLSLRDIIYDHCQRRLGELPHVNATPYQPVEFTSAQVAQLSRRYADDFRYFNYTPSWGPF